MKSSNTEKASKPSALIALAVAVTLFAVVMERVLAALGQWYKFTGYSNNGHINLSLNTALYFSGLAVAVFLCSFGVNRASTGAYSSRSRALSVWAMCLSASALIAYWILGFSSLNVWRA